VQLTSSFRASGRFGGRTTVGKETRRKENSLRKRPVKLVRVQMVRMREHNCIRKTKFEKRNKLEQLGGQVSSWKKKTDLYAMVLPFGFPWNQPGCGYGRHKKHTRASTQWRQNGK
jgi:hypothetical protein